MGKEISPGRPRLPRTSAQTPGQFRPSLVVIILVALLDRVGDGVVAGAGDLGLEVHVDELALLGGPVAVGVAVVDDFVGAGIADLGGGVGEGALGLPLDAVAGVLGDEEGRRAALIGVGVDALFHRKVEHLALGHGRRVLRDADGGGEGGARGEDLLDGWDVHDRLLLMESDCR